MAWSSDFISASEWSDYQANVPLIVARSALVNAEDWAWNAQLGNFDGSETNYGNATHPVWLAADGFAHALTEPTPYGGGTGVWYFLMELDPAESFDSLAILGHNFHTLSAGPVAISLEIDDDPDFGAAEKIVPDYAVPDARRLAFFELNHDAPNGDGINAQRYTGASYARLTISTNGFGLFVAEPTIGEIILGRRRQLHTNPRVPWDDRQMRSDVAEFRSESGVITRYTRSAGQRVVSATKDYAHDAEAQAMWDAYADCGYGARPVLFCLHPADAHYAAGRQAPLHGFLGPDLSLALQGPYKRTGMLEFAESAPYLSGEA